MTPSYERRRKILRKGPGVSRKEIKSLPAGWSIRRVQELYDLNVIIDYADGNHGSLYPRKAEFGATGVVFVTAKNLVRGRVIWSSCAHLSEARANQLVKGWAQGGDVLLTHNATVGRVARVEPNIERFLLGTSVTFYRLNQLVLSSDFFYVLLLSNFWQDQMKEVMAQTTRNQVSIQKQADFYVVIPPLPEQDRIVAMVNRLIELCDELETALASADGKRERLLESLLQQSLSMDTAATMTTPLPDSYG
jgi:type I restriction enzyme S subunit